MERLWAETEATLSTLEGATPLDVQLVKHAALLGFAGGLAGLQATAPTLAATTGTSLDVATSSLSRLREARALSYRSFGETYHVWQGSTFDLEGALREAREAVPQRTPLADLLRGVLPPRPVVARRHSYRTGTTRVFDVVYASDTDAPRVATAKRRTDGRIVYVLPEADEAVEVVERLRQATDDPMVLLAVPDGIAALRENVRDLAFLDWVREHAEALQGDAAARREVAEQRAALAAEVERRLSRLLAADATGRNPCTWIRAGEPFRIADARALQSTLTRVCDEVYPHAPEVWNELLNRRRPSSSAVRGLKLLLDGVVHRADEPRLGIEGTPAEFGMYASVLQEAGLHRQDESGRWHFGRPAPDLRPGCAAVWDAIAEILLRDGGAAVPLHSIYGRLSASPYGVRPGLIPVFLFAFVAHVRDEIAFYESDTFVRDLTFETVERLLKSQEKGQDTFTLQWVRIEGERAEALGALAPLLGLPATVDQPLPVAIRLLQHVHDLPLYVRRTGSLSESTVAVREALHRATDPTALLFEALPKACGLPPLRTTSDGDRKARTAMFAERLGLALRDLSGAYDHLLDEIGDRLARAFHLRSLSAEQRRHELAERALALLPAASDLSLRAFLVRATDEILDTQGWTESLAALLARRPPSQWADADLDQFDAGLREIADAFHKLEPLAHSLADEQAAHLADGDSEASSRVRHVRLFVKTLSESEEDGVIHLHPEDDDLVEDLHATLDHALVEAGVTSDVELAALSRLVAERLRRRRPQEAERNSG